MSVEKLNFNHVQHEKKSFTTLLNSVLQNVNDAEALGLWCYLSSLPNNWAVNKKALMNRFNIGRHKLDRLLKYLSEKGLIEAGQTKNSDGTFGKSCIEIKCGYDFNEKVIHNHNVNENKDITPVAENPPTAKTTVVQFSASGLSDSGKTAPTNNIYNTNKINIKNKRENSASKIEAPLSQSFEPNDQSVELCQSYGLDLREELESFEHRHKGQKSQYEFQRWLKMASLYKKTRLPKNSYTERPNEARSTVQFWGPGHPSYDALHGTRHQ